MIIGFISQDLSTITFFKEIVKEFPLHGYVFYCDTRASSLKGNGNAFESSRLIDAVAFLQSKGSTVIAVPDNTVAEHLAQFPVASSIVIETFDTVMPFLANAETFEPEETDVRIVHLTEHTQDTDRQVAQLLGGHFIAE